MKYSKLVLFDIDGTLVSKSTGHTEAFAVAFYKNFNQYASIHMIKHQGMTDRQIIRKVMQDCGIPDTDIDAKMNECMDVMVNYFKAVQSSIAISLLPGVQEFLQLLKESGCLLGLVTGNLEPIAYGKLHQAGVDEFFVLGGFGSDAEDRSKLVGKAIATAKETFGFEPNDNVYLFGDAPQDMQAGNANGIHTIGVTTGVYQAADLSGAGAEYVVAALSSAADIILA